MILKFDSVSAQYFGEFITFLHGKENELIPAESHSSKPVVALRSIKPHYHANDVVYDVVLYVRQRIAHGNQVGEQVDPKYLLRVYKILG